MSRFFKQINEAGDPCPLCKTKKQGEILAVPIAGTQEGSIVQVNQVHRECVELTIQAYYEAIMDDNLEKKG